MSQPISNPSTSTDTHVIHSPEHIAKTEEECLCCTASKLLAKAISFTEQYAEYGGYVELSDLRPSCLKRCIFLQQLHLATPDELRTLVIAERQKVYKEKEHDCEDPSCWLDDPFHIVDSCSRDIDDTLLKADKQVYAVKSLTTDEVRRATGHKLEDEFEAIDAWIARIRSETIHTLVENSIKFRPDIVSFKDHRNPAIAGICTLLSQEERIQSKYLQGLVRIDEKWVETIKWVGTLKDGKWVKLEPEEVGVKSMAVKIAELKLAELKLAELKLAELKLAEEDRAEKRATERSGNRESKVEKGDIEDTGEGSVVEKSAQREKAEEDPDSAKDEAKA